MTFNTLRIVISRESAEGTYVKEGVADVDLGSDYAVNNEMGVTLRGVVDSAGMILVPGTTYRLAAENLSSSDAAQDPTDRFDEVGDTVVMPLGTVDFTYQAR